VVMDERAGTRLAQRDGTEVHGSLWLIANGILKGVLARTDAEMLVDELADTGMRLPIEGQGLLAWAYESGLLP